MSKMRLRFMSVVLIFFFLNSSYRLILVLILPFKHFAWLLVELIAIKYNSLCNKPWTYGRNKKIETFSNVLLEE